MAYNIDWLYSEDRLEMREKILSTLLRRYGSHMKMDGTPEHSTESIYACAHDYISQGNTDPSGAIDFYEEHYK